MGTVGHGSTLAHCAVKVKIFYVIIYTLHISIEHLQDCWGSHGRSQLAVDVIGTVVSGEQDRELECTIIQYTLIEVQNFKRFAG